MSDILLNLLISCYVGISMTCGAIYVFACMIVALIRNKPLEDIL